MSKALTAEAILAAKDHHIVKEDVNEWGGHVHIRTLSEREYITWISDSKEDGKDPSIMLLQRTLCDEDGGNLFSEEQVEALANKAVRVIDRLVKKALEVNGLNLRDEEALVGKLESPKSDSPTD